jgi:glycosyltransferase involved in cell wall biosynthesis
MKLVFLSNHVPPYRVSTLVALRREVGQLDVVLSSADCAPGLPENEVTVHFLPALKVPQRRRHVNGYVERFEVHLPRAVVGTLRRLDPDCVVAPEFGLRTALAAAYCAMHRKPLVVHADLSEEYERGRGAVRLMLRKALLRVTDRVLANGRSAARYVESLGYDPDLISYLPYATDVENFGRVPRRKSADGVLRIVYVGQLIERKGLEPFVQMLSDELAGRPATRVELTLAGDGDRRAALGSIRCPPNLQVRLPGPVEYEKLDALYAECDVFVMPTLSDTWGLVVNESMASGLPVLGSLQSQAVLEMVQEGREGWLFDARSAPSMRDAISRCLDSDPDERRRMGDRARTRAQYFSPERSARQIVEACRDAIEARRRRAPRAARPAPRQDRSGSGR